MGQTASSQQRGRHVEVWQRCYRQKIRVKGKSDLSHKLSSKGEEQLMSYQVNNDVMRLMISRMDYEFCSNMRPKSERIHFQQKKRLQKASLSAK